MKATVICGDSCQVLPMLGLFDIVVTDPPYSSGSTRKEWRSSSSVEAALYEAAKHVTPGGLMAVMSASSGRSVDRICGAVTPVLPLGRVLSWCKPHTRCRAAGPFGWQTVLVLLFGKMGGKMTAPDHIVADAMQYRKQGTTGHPAEVPASVAEWLCRGLSGRANGGSVLDPFCGSGALLHPFTAAHEVTGIELQEQWADLARARLEDVC